MLPEFEKPERYEGPDGEAYAEKPEYMTSLRGCLLVPKDHGRIRLRGRLDSLQAGILEAQLAFRKLGLETVVADLQQVLARVQDILRCEVLEIPLAPAALLGLEEEELHERSHHPAKYYGIPHISPDISDGEAVIRLNRLRTETRETEILAYQTLKIPGGRPEREDLLQALNRLSSVFYVMMLRAKTGAYIP